MSLYLASTTTQAITFQLNGVEFAAPCLNLHVLSDWLGGLVVPDVWADQAIQQLVAYGLVSLTDALTQGKRGGLIYDYAPISADDLRRAAGFSAFFANPRPGSTWIPL